MLNAKTERFVTYNDATNKLAGLAFFGIAKEDAERPEEEQQATVWVANCDCEVHAECPASKALDKACAIYDGASLVRRPKVL